MAISMGQLGDKFAMAASKLGPLAEKNLNVLAQTGVGVYKEEIQNFHAVDTATMLNSVTAERIDKTTYLVGPTTYYAPYVALGTSRMPGRPFHMTASRRLRDENADLFTARDLGL